MFPSDKERRLRKFWRQGGRCHWCGGEMTLQLNPNGKPPRNYASFEHLQRRREGGAGKPNNVVLACRDCNNRREHGIKTHLLHEEAAHA